jgi:membrane associated rhomboid family serine protease
MQTEEESTMKENIKSYLIENRPRTIINIVCLFFLTTLLVIVLNITGHENIANYLYLYTSNVFEPRNYYRLVTSACFSGSLITWFFVSIALILSGFIIEQRTTKKRIIQLTIFSAMVGGLIFIILKNDKTNIPYIGQSMIVCAFIAFAIICGLIFWKKLILFEKGIVVFFIINVILMPLNINDADIFFTEVIVMVLVFILTMVLKPFRTSGKFLTDDNSFTQHPAG